MLISMLPASLVQSLGWALLHSLWQGALIAVILAGVMRVLARATSQTRYLVSCTALVLLVVSMAMAGGYAWETPAAPTLPMAPNIMDVAIEPTTANFTPRPNYQSASSNVTSLDMIERVNTYLPCIVLAWGTGLLLVSLRMIYGWTLLRRMRIQGTSGIIRELEASITSLSQSLGIKRAVRVLESTRAVTPMVVGWLRPVILVPAACLTGLSTQQLEAVIAHELAHIRRHDYLVNLVQCVIETLLFYHPAVWWIGRVIRQERERCCDDIAVRVSGNREGYARALLHLAESVIPPGTRLTPAANGGDLADRIRRLLMCETKNSSGHTVTGVWTAIISLVVAGSLVAGAWAQDSPTDDPAKPLNGLLSGQTGTEPQIESPEHIIFEVPYDKLVEGDPAYNIVVRPGDIIKINSKVDPGYIYIQGKISRPGAYNSPGHNTLTLKQLIASAGGPPPDSPPLYVKLIRRQPDDREQITQYSVDDLFDGWVQDMFLAPNDVVLLTDELSMEDTTVQEDDPAQERRQLRQNLLELRDQLATTQLEHDAALLEHGNEHPDVIAVVEHIRVIEDQSTALNEQLRPEAAKVMKIIPAPEPRQKKLGILPRDEDLVVRQLSNNAKPLSRVRLSASARDGYTSQTILVRELDGEGKLNIPGLTSTNFVGRTINDVQAEVLVKMRQNNEYQRVDQVVITLPDEWTFTVTGQPRPSFRPGLYSLPHANFRLLEALGMANSEPVDAQTILVIREAAVEVEE